MSGEHVKPLSGLLVLEFGQFLAGPSAALRLADLGARVIKVERPGGELGRRLYISNLELDGDSTLFHIINRNKESITANLKETAERDMIRNLIRKADVLIETFRPGVMRGLGLGYEDVVQINPRLIYASVTGYGSSGSWREKPGQDLLAQALSGLTWLSGNADDPPIPFGLAVADMFAGAHLAQGILACLVRRGITGKGGRVEVSLLESVLDLQFEVLTTYLNDGGQLPPRGTSNSAHAYLAAPYGIYATANGYLAVAMAAIPQLAKLLELPDLAVYEDPKSWFAKRDVIKRALANRLRENTIEHWLGILEPADVWCAPVLTWSQLVSQDGFRELQMVQTVARSNGAVLQTTRCPIRIDGQKLFSAKGSPRAGQHNATLKQELSESLKP